MIELRKILNALGYYEFPNALRQRCDKWLVDNVGNGSNDWLLKRGNCPWQDKYIVSSKVADKMYYEFKPKYVKLVYQRQRFEDARQLAKHLNVTRERVYQMKSLGLVQTEAIRHPINW